MGGGLKRRASSLLLVILFLAYFTNAQSGEDGGVIGGLDEIKDICLCCGSCDVYPLSYGVETVGGVMAVLIPKNSLAPTKNSKVFTTTRDQQTNVNIQVFLGNWRLTKNCMLLGELNLTGIPPAPRGTPRIEVTFVVDHEATLFVKAEDKASGKSEKMKIIDGGGDPYSSRAAEIWQMVREARELEKKEERERIVGNNIMRNHIDGKDRLAQKLEAEAKELIERSTSYNENAIAIVVDEDHAGWHGL